VEKIGNNVPEQFDQDSWQKPDIEPWVDYDQMPELEQARLEAVHVHGEIMDLEQKLRQIYGHYEKVVTDIPDGTTVTIQPKAGSEIRIFSIDDDRRTGFINLGDNFVGKKLEDEIFSHITELVSQDSYIRLDNNQALKKWVVTRIEKPDTSE
jgi:hypothetical protein